MVIKKSKKAKMHLSNLGDLLSFLKKIRDTRQDQFGDENKKWRVSDIGMMEADNITEIDYAINGVENIAKELESLFY